MNGITNIEYDLLGNPRKITFSNNRSIEYIYSADGRRLRTIHSKPKEAGIFDRPIRAKLRPGGIETMAMDKDSTDYIGNLILKDGHPSQYLFAGGYASFDAKADTLNGMHYYISDYLGNNRMVVNQNGTIEQVTHYYPYGPRSHKEKIDNLLARRRGLTEGEVIGDISHTNDDVTNDYKFENKELDRTFGLDWYDIQARQYDAIGVPGWNAIDPLSEKYYSISPYAYCGGNPVNFGDYDGRFPHKLGAEIAQKIHNEYRPLGESITPVQEATNTSSEDKRYYFETFSHNREDGIVITREYNMSKDNVDMFAGVGAGMEVAGVGMACSVVAAPEGAVVSTIGAGVSTAASLGSIGIDVINGNYKSAGITVALQVFGAFMKYGIKKLIPAKSLDQQIVHDGYSASQDAVTTTISCAPEKSNENE